MAILEPKNNDTLILMLELQVRIKGIFGFYHDSSTGMVMFARDIFDNQRQSLSSSAKPDGSPKTMEEFDQRKYAMGVGDPNDRTSYVVHVETQGEKKVNNSKNGTNHHVLSQAVISFLYSIWNDDYRSRIAKTLNLKANDIMVDFFGDIRHLRNSIIHHDGIALAEVEKCKTINFFKEGDKIIFTEDQMHVLWFAAMESIDLLIADHCGIMTNFGVKYNAFGEPIKAS